MNLAEQGGRYTPLNTNRVQIHGVIKDKGLLSPPKPIIRGPGINAHHKYCEFYKVFEHRTADCIDLKK